MIQTKFSPHWEKFRDGLSNQQMLNLSQLIRIEVQAGSLGEGTQRTIVVTPEPKAAVWVFMHGGVVHLVGAYWIRRGEPTEGQLALFRLEVALIQSRKGSLL